MPTPIRRQYLELKERYPDTVLFFRLGDFYETFDDDAKIASDVLQITLTSKPMGKNLRVPLAGVPYHSIDGHVAKLVKSGHRVAICEQMADPSEVKGIVPRDVVRVVTSGTVTAESSLEDSAPNYLGAYAERGGEVAAGLADITTGELNVATGDDALDVLAQHAPAELLVEADGPFEAFENVRTRPALSDVAIGAELANQFGDHAVEHLVEGKAAAAALAQVLAYIRETYPSALQALQRVRTLAGEATMRVDARTLRNLEVLPVPERPASLFSVLNATQTAMGARMLRSWLVAPLLDREALTGRHDGVAWAVDHQLESERLRTLLHGIGDLGRLAGKVGARSANPRDLHALRGGLRSALDIGAALEGVEPPDIIRNGLTALSGAAEPLLTLDAALDPDPPQSFDEGGVIGPGFSPEIDTLRSMTRDARGYLLGLEREERERTGIKTLKVGHNKVFGYYLEVSSANTELVPERFQRRQTLVGAERYVTEELKQYESQLIGARERLVELEKQAFAQLVETLAAGLPSLHRVAEGLGTLDVVLALGHTALQNGYVRPHFTEGSLKLAGARHPVVEAALGPGRFVPNDCRFDGDRQILVLTGPNMSGKSTYLRQVALIALMAQAGSFVPATEAELPLFDRAFTRIGAQDDLAAGQSTFMVEMVETAQILHHATPRSLVVLDEVGRGTSTFDGMAIARSVIEFLHNRKEAAAATLFATHYHELTDLADTLPRVHNIHVAVHEQGDDVVFEHRIVDGPSDRSYGVHVARLAGLPPSVVTRAEHLLTELERPPIGSEQRADSQFQPTLFAVPSKVESDLMALDVDSLTPIEAIQKLYELRQQAAGSAT